MSINQAEVLIGIALGTRSVHLEQVDEDLDLWSVYGGPNGLGFKVDESLMRELKNLGWMGHDASVERLYRYLASKCLLFKYNPSEWVLCTP